MYRSHCVPGAGKSMDFVVTRSAQTRACRQFAELTNLLQPDESPAFTRATFEPKFRLSSGPSIRQSKRREMKMDPNPLASGGAYHAERPVLPIWGQANRVFGQYAIQ